MGYKGIIALSVAGGIGYYLYRYFSIQAALLNQYEIHLQSADLKTITSDLVTMDITMLFRNKSKIEIEIQNLYGEVSLDGQLVGNFNDTTKFLVFAQDSSVIPISFAFSPAKILTNVVSFALQAIKTSDLPVTIKGYATVKSGFLKLSVPFTYNTTVKNYLAG